MSLRILFADDSVTAQNMGKKILTEAGYEVVAVSNGAAAVKKIAEQKPDIIILDVYMPGYSGLEVCEKVRSSIATIKTPVLLTVGKMEPYKPEDANRVRADGIIIKPFEASDLLAIVKKFEERIGQTAAAVPPPPPTIAMQAMEQPAEVHHEPPPTRSMQPMVEVPDHMATSSAFSDLLGTDATRMEQFHVPVPVPVAEAVPLPQVEEVSAPAPATDYDMPAAWRTEPEPQPAIVETAVMTETPTAPEPVAARPIQIPVYREPEATHFEVVPTAAPPLGDIDIPREAGLQESAEETTRNTVADAREPDLVPTAHHISAPVEAQSAVAQPIPAETVAVPEMPAPVQSEEMSAPPQPEHLTPEPEMAPSFSEAEFEARVAAAMAAYGQPAETAALSSEAAAARLAEQVQEVHADADETQALEASAIAQAEPVMEHQPEVISAPEPAAQETESPAPAAAEKEEPVFAHVAAAGANHDAIAASVEAELPAAVHAVAEATAANQNDHENIAQAVHRVMERMKENLVQEIVRELKTKK